jgi:Lar family restriction alleviation protein
MAEKQWCPGCSREVEGVCHHFNCAIGPNGLDAQSRSSAATTDALLPCPFCGPGQSMVDPWYDDVAKRWSIGCGRCGASSGRSVHAEGSKEAAIKAWNTRGVGDVAQAAPTPVVWRVRYCGQWMYFEDKGNAEIYAQGDDNTEPLYAAQPPAAPVEPYIYGSDGRSDAVETDADLPTYQDVRGILPRSSAGNEHPVLEQADKLNDLGFKAGWLGAIDEAEKMMLRWSAEAKEFEQDSERCKIQGNVCRNAATAIRNLAKLVPDEPQEALRYAATKAVEAYRRAQSEGEVVIAMENLERALSPDEPRRSVTRPEGKPHG